MPTGIDPSFSEKKAPSWTDFFGSCQEFNDRNFNFWCLSIIQLNWLMIKFNEKLENSALTHVLNIREIPGSYSASEKFFSHKGRANLFYPYRLVTVGTAK